MVGQKAAAIVADDDEKMDTQALLRLGAWGICAAVSVGIAVFAARTDLGAKRFSAGLIAIASPPDESQAATAANLLARTAVAEREARRAAETVVAISADRERTAARLSAMERDIGDISGSVGRAIAIATEGKTVPPVLTMSSASLLNQQRNAPPAGWANSVPATGDPMPLTPNQPAATPPAHERISIQAAAAPQNVPLPRPVPPHPQTNPSLHTVAAAPPPQATPQVAPAKPDETAALFTGSIGVNTASDVAPPKVEFGVDLGPALNVSRLRSRWTKLSNERPDLVKGLRPLVTVRDTGAGKPVELRLVVGPLASVNAASDFCGALQPASAPYVCRPAVFDGQRLNVQ